MNKKADVNWVIISMVIGMIALFVIIYIFYSQAKGAQTGIQGLSSCPSRGGTCQAQGQCQPPSQAFYHYGCPENGKDKNSEYCCIPPEAQTTS